MDMLASLFVGYPVTIAFIASVFLVVFIASKFLDFRRIRRPNWFFILFLSWSAYAAWEWLVQVRTPEANIRVDLLVIWPVLALLTLWGVFRGLR